MKDSGIEWIGDIPEDWEVTKFKNIIKFTNGYAFNSEDMSNEGQYPIIRIGDIYDSKVNFVNSVKCNIDVEALNSFLIKKDDILIAMSGATVGKLGYVDNQPPKSFINQRVGIIRCENPKYAFYSISTNSFLQYIYLLSEGSAQPNISTKNINEYKISIPQTQQEQQQIANFLDKKVAEIDHIIDKTKLSIEEYKKYKQSLITETVTKGLNKDAKMKDSGIEWIGEIPEHWEVTKLKHITSSQLQYGANASGVTYSEELPRYIRITDISNDNELKDEGRLSLPVEDSKQFILKNNDILFARSGATVGKTFIYKERYGLSAFAGYLIKATIIDSVLPELIYYYTLSSAYNEWKNRIFIQATIQNIGADKYSNMEIVTPKSKEEQQQIINFLEKKLNEIDTLISQKEHLLKELESYKKSLIFECVTGKREVGYE